MKKMTYKQISNIEDSVVEPMVSVLTKCNNTQYKDAPTDNNDLIQVAKFLTACNNTKNVSKMVELILCSDRTDFIKMSLDHTFDDTLLSITFSIDDDDTGFYCLCYGLDGYLFGFFVNEYKEEKEYDLSEEECFSLFEFINTVG